MKLGVVIPVFRGSDVLERSVGSLVHSRLADRGSVALVVNDGEAASLTAAGRCRELLRSAGTSCAVLRSLPGRALALQVGDAALPAGHRLYLDQDAALAPGTLDALIDALQAAGEQPLFATARARVAPCGWLTRLHYRAWSALPYVRCSPATMGAYAVSAGGRRRWGSFPAVLPDDKFVRLHFAPHERAVVPGSYEVVAPEGWGSLVAARRRYLRGNAAMGALAPGLRDPAARHRGLGSLLLRRPDLVPAFGAFAAVYAAAAWQER